MSSELTYISAGKVSNYTTMDALKVDIVKTLARWFSNYYVFGEHAVESWVLEAGGVYVLYSTFQFELQLQGNVYELAMYAVGRFRRHGSSFDYFQRIFDGLEHQLGHPDREFDKMFDAYIASQAEDYIDFGSPFQCTHSNSITGVLPVAGIISETDGILLTTEDAGVLEESLDEDLDEDLDDDDNDDDDVKLRDMTDAQIEKYVELSGQCPRDECNEWEMDYEGGDILRYSYIKFANVAVEDQRVSNITITRAQFLGTMMRNCVFDQVHFDECDFKSVVLENVTFNNCHFTECDLDPYMSVDKTCIVENIDYDEEMRQAFLDDNVTYSFY